jgi:hypothetical protein
VAINAAAGRVARLRVLILEAGTFKLSGTVASEDGGGPLSAVKVDVLSGTGQGIETMTSSAGQFALYGVAGPVRIRVAADGFGSQMRDVTVVEHQTMDQILLRPSEPTPSVTGPWTLTVRPSATCPSSVPDGVRNRSYRVEFSQTGTHLLATISGPTLLRSVTDLPGTLIGSRLQMSIWGETSYGDWSYPSVVDVVGGTFGFDGIVSGTLRGSSIEGVLDGDIVFWNEPTFAPTWYCRAKDHLVTLTRQP